MTTILLARHGQASFGQENYDQLSELGVTQARMLGQHYASTQRRIDAIFTGSLVRQQDSARHFWETYQPSLATDSKSSIINTETPDSYVLPVFDEFNHKDVFIKSDPAFTSQAAIAAELAKTDAPQTRLAELFDRAMQRWHHGDNDADYVESWPQFSSRAQQALEQVRSQVANLSHLEHDSTVLVFTSGGVIAAITAQLLQQSSQVAYQLNKSLVNTGVTAITLRDQSTRLLSVNEYSHLFADGKRFVTWR
ncbi:histidine phosphatase family protein [Psychrobacter sp. 72-O-c]|uniref:histidine phosphatase family protein n=1 Tax=Psychrobacter sp. 72-O-c TaxID=2774125 RepID=UPI00191AE29C|nr:histidine phosphatase family protein [Psychrobacter sp. 72-O-c]